MSSLYDMAELLLKRIKDQEADLADWTNAKEAFAQMSDPGVMMLGLKGFVNPYYSLLLETSKQVEHYQDWADRFDALTQLLSDNLAKTGISAMITIDWDKFKNQEEHRERRFVAVSVLLRRLLLGCDWLKDWEF